MKRLFIALIVALFTLPAFALVEVNTSGLSDAQRAELVKQAEAMKSQATSMSSPEKVDQWINTGERFGKMMGGAAREIGVAVNDFVKTPVGMMTAALIVWNYMGGMVVHLVSGWALLLIAVPLWGRFLKRQQEQKIVYDETKPVNWLGRYPIKTIEREGLNSEMTVVAVFGYGVIFAVSIFTMFAW